jgi:4-diphosphocytidyl-2-C-methyl-D-erythritol kinase
VSLAYDGTAGEGEGCLRALGRAKLTLSLRVAGRRDDGYHDLEALVISLEDPHDTLTMHILPTAGVLLTTTGPAARGVPAGRNNYDNLAAGAALALLQVTDDAGPFAAAGFEINLHKEIPAGSGLGGGSADAAAALRAGDRLLELGLDSTALLGLAARIGSDVAFCVLGGTAWMRGRGEVVEPLPAVGAMPLVVAAPAFAVSTAAVYAAWDDLGSPRSERAVTAPEAVAGLLPGGLVNDLEPAAEAVEPRLRPFREALENLAGAPAILAGSGSAHAVVVPDSERARDLAREVRFRLGVRAWATRPVPSGVDF